MPKKVSYTLSNQAAEDLSEIARYTVRQFGVDQAKKYGQELESSFGQLATFPLMGKSAEALFPSLRRFEFRSHAVFYLPRADDLYIVRVLHISMDADLHLRK
jgi:toxin ParE1/3/4